MPVGRSSLNNNKKSSRSRKVIPFKKKKNHKNLFAIILLFIIVGFLLLFTPIFNIKTIEVSGNDKFTKDDIIILSGLQTGQNIFKANYFKIKDDLLKNQYIQKVKFKRSYPNKVNIIIEERKPAAYFQFVSSYLIIDKSGIVLDVVNSLNDTKIPVINGVKFKEYKLGSVLNYNQEDKAKFDMAIKILNEIIIKNQINIFNKIDVTNINKIIVGVYNDKYQINLIDGQNLDYKFNKLNKVIEDLEKNKSPKGFIEFTTDNKTTFKLQ